MNSLRCILALSLLSGSFLYAQCTDPRSLINVTGVGEIKAVPDEVELKIGIETFARETVASKAGNAAKQKAVLTALRSLGIDEKDLQISALVVAPRYKRGEDSNALLGYATQAEITIRLRQLDKLETLNQNVLAAGASSFEQVEYRTSRLVEHRAAARAQAIKAAREKAEFLASQLGQRIGKAVSITEGERPSYASAISASNSFYYSVDEAILAKGVISVREAVNVSFELQ